MAGGEVVPAPYLHSRGRVTPLILLRKRELSGPRAACEVRRPCPWGKGIFLSLCPPHGRVLLLGRAGMAGFPRCVVAGEGDPLSATAGRSLPRCGCRRLSPEAGCTGGAGRDPCRPWGEGHGGNTRFSRYPRGGEDSLSRVGGGTCKGPGRGGQRS